VKITAQFARPPNGPNHAYDVLVNGVSKQLTVEMQLQLPAYVIHWHMEPMSRIPIRRKAGFGRREISSQRPRQLRTTRAKKARYFAGM
jgi:hypothetical protein